MTLGPRLARGPGVSAAQTGAHLRGNHPAPPSTSSRRRDNGDEGSDVSTIRPRLRLLTSSEGQTLAEYAVILGVVTLAVVGVFTGLSGGISGALTNVSGAF